jgi:hypothetical protein
MCLWELPLKWREEWVDLKEQEYQMIKKDEERL